jgi:isopenicillin N synthase-like dioxygenase
MLAHRSALPAFLWSNRLCHVAGSIDSQLPIHIPVVIPVVDLTASDAAHRIDEACRTTGFFALTGHGVTADRRERLLTAARRFFALPAEMKQQVSLGVGGRAWRGWFPLGDELTSGVPDLKEGYYFGRELPPSPLPLHGPNVWPAQVPELRELVTDWMATMEQIGQQVLAAMAIGLGLDGDWFRRHLTADPTALFRIFNYPPHPDGAVDRWGVAEHSDYGLLTLLVHDGTPGLEVCVGTEWIEAPSDPDLIICNLGDMLDRLTRGRYRSTPHRVRNHGAHDRISLPFFLDPSWSAAIEPLPLDPTFHDERGRWDHQDLSAFDGVYGDWLLAKVARVFPHLAGDVLAAES